MIGNDRPLRWGLVGTSQVARRWVIPALRTSQQTLAAIYSRTLDRGRAFAEAFDIPVASTNLNDLWDARADAVYVSSTNDLHAEHVIAAARAGVHVLCEKPLAMTVEEASAMQDACDRHGVLLATNHHFRGLPANQVARRLIADGAIGTPRAAWFMHASLLPEEWHGWRLRDPTVGGGIRLDLTVHDVDLLRFLLDREVEDVVGLDAHQGLAQPPIEDALMTVLRFQGEVLAFCHDGWNVPSTMPSLELRGSDGAITITHPTSADPKAAVQLHGREGVRDVLIGPQRDPYVETIKAFTAAVAGHGTPLSTGRDGIAALAAALRATGCGHTPPTAGSAN
jgi:1,5-anhydro-D-fructose reductase (1,5-anhydro-D-mannitol-forming)